MDVRPSSEQVALRDAVAHVVDRLAPVAVGQLDDVERAAKLDAAVSASGWRELRTPTDDGTPWASGVEVAIVAEGLGRGLADTPFLGPTLAADLRRRAGAPVAAAPETVLLGAGLGALVVADGARVPTGAVAVDALGATSALCLATAPAGWALVTVPIDGGAATTDLTRRVAHPASTDAVRPVEGASVLDDEDVAAWTALGLASTCADLVGTMEGAVELATEYAAARVQYGRAIGSFQAVQHLLADAFVATEGSRSIARSAAWAVDALGPDDALVAASAAKAYCSRAARAVCETSIQVHGGIGNTWECRAHVHLRRALLSSELLGGVRASLERVLAARGIGDDDGLR